MVVAVAACGIFSYQQYTSPAMTTRENNNKKKLLIY